MKQILNRLINHEQLSKIEARTALVNISEGKYNQSQIAVFFTVYMKRNVSLEKPEGFRDSLPDLCLAIDFSEYNFRAGLKTLKWRNHWQRLYKNAFGKRFGRNFIFFKINQTALTFI